MMATWAEHYAAGELALEVADTTYSQQDHDPIRVRQLAALAQAHFTAALVARLASGDLKVNGTQLPGGPGGAH